MATPSSPSSSSPIAPHPPAQRRASSVPNLRERPAASPQLIVLQPPLQAPTLLAQASVAPSLVTESTAVAQPPAAVQPAAPRRRPAGSGWRYSWRRMTAFLGYGRGNEARKELVTLVFTLVWGTLQIAIVTFLLVAAATMPSRHDASMSEWKACDKPLAVWAIAWCIRVFIGFVTAIWAWRISKHRQRNRDAEAARASAANRNQTVVQPALPQANRSQTVVQQTLPQGMNATAEGERQPSAPNTAAANTGKALGRITTATSFFSLGWFISAHVFLYSSLSTCRLTSPHLWWADFAIVCIGYVVILEVLFVGVTVFIFVPLIFLAVNVVLICLGRRPLLPGTDINPEIPKLSQRLVDRIPLVLYIPPPPDGVADKSAAHTYPPRSNTPASSVSRRSMFRFIRRRRRRNQAKDKEAELSKQKAEKVAEKPAETWEDRWEKGEYPFVRLEENRAACAICLMDFEAPKKIRESLDEPRPAIADAQVPEAVVNPGEDEEDEEVIAGADEEDENLRLQDAGEGVQPLRLLSCGHVFHKTCVDPWLVDVSGRCPTCQQPVEIPEPEKSGKRSRRRRG